MQNTRNGKGSQALVGEEAKAQTLIRSLLNGEGQEGISPGECGPWSEVIASLVEAGQTGGTKAIRRAFDVLTRSVPGLAQLVCGDLPPSTSAKTRWTTDELLTTHFPDPKWAIPGILPVGLSILAGRPKLGKSWLALQIAQAVGSGGMALGQRVDPGEVIYFALEDSPRRIQKRLEKQGCPPGLPITFVFEKGEGLIGIARLIEVSSPRLLVIDTLSRILPAKLDQNNVGEVTSSLSILQGMALKRESALLGVDHHRKTVGEDHIDDILGSTGKSAVADALLGLFRQRGQRVAMLKVSGRDMEDQELALEWDGLLCCWQSLGSAEEVRKDTVEGEILDAIRNLVAVGEIPSTANIAAYVGRNRGYINHRLADLLNQGKVIKGKKVGKTQPYYLPK